MTRAVEWFAKQSVKVERVMTDNGSAFRAKEFASTCEKLSVRHKRSRPYTPRTNGKAERFIQTLLREWAYRFSYETSQKRKQWLVLYLDFYNYHRSLRSFVQCTGQSPGSEQRPDTQQLADGILKQPPVVAAVNRLVSHARPQQRRPHV